MNDRLVELYRGVAVHATADLEHRAALELLALVMLADQTIADTEVELVREISVDWRGDGYALEPKRSNLTFSKPKCLAARRHFARRGDEGCGLQNVLRGQVASRWGGFFP